MKLLFDVFVMFLDMTGAQDGSVRMFEWNRPQQLICFRQAGNARVTRLYFNSQGNKVLKHVTKIIKPHKQVTYIFIFFTFYNYFIFITRHTLLFKFWDIYIVKNILFY